MNSYLRVTEILSPFSGYSNIADAILEAAKKRGTAVHEACDAAILGFAEFGISEKYAKYMESFSFWNMDKKYVPKPPRFYCDKYGITGECDAIYQYEDGLALVDFKTSSRESKTWCLQGSAYAYLAKQAGYEIKTIEFIKLSKEGKFPKIYTYQENFDLFLKCLEIYRIFFCDQKREDFLDEI